MRAYMGGMAVHLDAAVWQDWGGRRVELLLLSVGGAREAVRAVLAGAAKGKEILLEVEGRFIQGVHYRHSRFYTARVKGGHHGLWAAEAVGKGVYVARAPHEEREALWASRALGLPIPIPWWPEIRESLLLPSFGAVALRAPRRREWEDLVERMTGRRPKAAPT